MTQYMGPASACAAVLRTIDEDMKNLQQARPDMFTFSNVKTGVVEIRDFQTTGVVAFARGCPFYELETGKLDIGGRRVQVNESMRKLCEDAIDGIVKKL